MKVINVVVEDEEFEHIDAHKGDRSWREYLLDVSKYPKEKRGS